MSVLLLGRVKSKEQHHTTSMGMGLLCTTTAQLADFESVPDAGSVPSWIDL